MPPDLLTPSTYAPSESSKGTFRGSRKCSFVRRDGGRLENSGELLERHRSVVLEPPRERCAQRVELAGFGDRGNIRKAANVGHGPAGVCVATWAAISEASNSSCRPRETPPLDARRARPRHHPHMGEGQSFRRYRAEADRYGKLIFAAAAATACSGRRTYRVVVWTFA